MTKATRQMADDMSSNNGQQFVHEEARFASLQTRVGGLESKMDQISTTLTNFITKMDDRQRTPWALIVSVAVAVLLYITTIGGLAYAPVWAAIGRHDDGIATKVGRDEIEWRTARGLEDRQRMEKQLAEIRSDLVPKGEFDARIADLQRQIDRGGIPPIVR